MVFQIQPPQQLPETPPAIIEKAEIVDPREDIVERFFESAAQAFEDGKIAGKTEEEIIQITAGLVIQILIAKELGIDDGLMQAFRRQKSKIEAAFPKPVTEKTTPQVELNIFGRTRKKLQESLRGVLV